LGISRKPHDLLLLLGRLPQIMSRAGRAMSSALP